eukprot:scaffold22738_cov31-Tisochrysis_lutea.AAC.7
MATRQGEAMASIAAETRAPHRVIIVVPDPRLAQWQRVSAVLGNPYISEVVELAMRTRASEQVKNCVHLAACDRVAHEEDVLVAQQAARLASPGPASPTARRRARAAACACHAQLGRVRVLEPLGASPCGIADHRHAGAFGGGQLREVELSERRALGRRDGLRQQVVLHQQPKRRVIHRLGLVLEAEGLLSDLLLGRSAR